MKSSGYYCGTIQLPSVVIKCVFNIYYIYILIEIINKKMLKYCSRSNFIDHFLPYLRHHILHTSRGGGKGGMMKRERDNQVIDINNSVTN